MFDTNPYEEKMNAAFGFFQDELKKVRTGRAHAGMLDGVMVEAYGTKMPLNQVANITAITSAIRDNQSLGFNPSDDGRVVRVPVPALTEERRRQLVKQVSEKVEEARIAMRNIRQDALKEAKRMKDAKELSEDDLKLVEKEIDSLMSKMQAQIDEAFKAKEKDVLTV